ncbi:conserved membrane protein of unknown function [Petrocella atlantisensis]|uniref:Uncharacterized protein n=1 Tax=Petrocella atlantisensis TaxID=2173034 RepID=A0A3P7NUY6_9FIRM|nr:hypothetical protein [Petrocella atlantisensis]MCF8019454.1 hypothetical protein [Vallitaleaceae bacterium]VDN46964.1 conserved membrane protein of unknown function [Petrocella atlantisensis]
MKHLGTILGAAIAGMFVMSVWGAFAGAYGIGGGWFAGFAIISTMWFMNHFVGVHNNDGAWVDMAVGIGIAGTARGAFEAGTFQVVVDSLPTMIIVILGGITGATVGGLLQNSALKKD